MENLGLCPQEDFFAHADVHENTRKYTFCSYQMITFLLTPLPWIMLQM